MRIIYYYFFFSRVVRVVRGVIVPEERNKTPRGPHMSEKITRHRS